MKIKLTFTTILILFQIASSKAQPSKFKNYSDLKSEFEGVNLVLLGEKNHSDYPSMIEKVELIKFLHDTLGFDVLAMESSLFDMHQVNHMVENGEDIGETITKGIFPIWNNTPPVDSLVKYLKQKKIKLAGFDSQICSGGNDTCLKFTPLLQRYLDSMNVNYPNQLILTIEREFESFNKNYSLSSSFDNKTLADLEILIEALSTINSVGSRFWKQNLISIRGLFYNHYYNQINEKTASTFKAIDSNLRDSLMAQNVLYLLGAFPNKKIICWGATYHFSNDLTKLKIQGDDLTKSKPMGYYLKKELQEAVKIVGITDVKNQKYYELIEGISLNKNEKAYLLFKSIKNGCSQFISPSGACGDWSSALDLGIIINSKGNQFLNGHTINYENRNPLPFVHIQIENTSKGVVSNENGYFELLIDSIDQGRRLIFSTIGYQKDTIGIEDIKNSVQLIPKSLMLDEVIVRPNDDDALSIIHKITNEHVKHAPTDRFSMTLYSYQTEFNEQKPEKQFINESAIQIYYENRFQKGEVRESTILNVRKKQDKETSIPWPMASSQADFMTGFRFLNPATFKNLQIDSIYHYSKDSALNVIEYSHNKPTFKTSGYGVTPKWKGVIIYNYADYAIKSHEQTFQFEKNKDFGLYEITFEAQYFNYKNHILPRYLTSRYKIKKEDGKYIGEEKILVLEIDLSKPTKPTNKIFQFKDAHSNKLFWDSFNTIPKLSDLKTPEQ